MRTLHDLPRFSDRWSFLYLEMGRLDKEAEGLIFENAQGRTPVPIDQLSVVMLGPGTTVTHAATKVLAGNNCLLAWTGREGVGLYAASTGGTHSAKRLLRQAELVSDPVKREEVARRMYRFRFAEEVSEDATIEVLRGKEGYRVREAYADAAAQYGVDWAGRNYDPKNWNHADPLNRALSAANACLNGVCHAAILSAGYSPGLGFIHTGKLLSFVYDIADFYKTMVTVPVAFAMVAQGREDLERRVRQECREAFYLNRIMDRILPDIAEVLGGGDAFGESTDELEGRIISLADRGEERSIHRESEHESPGPALGEGD